jgi:VanZ family protein
MLIIVFSVMPDDSLAKMGIDNSGFRWDYLEHFGVFVFFSILYLQWRKADPVKKRIWGLIIIGVIFATSTELFQLFIQSRNFNYLDLLFNVAGLPIGAILIHQLHKIHLSAAT